MRTKRRGFALILTVWILAALVVLVGAFALSVQTETAVAGNFGDLAQCRWAARTGINRGLGEVERLIKLPNTHFGADRLTLSSESEGIDLDGPVFELTIEDEAGKVNINTASPEMLKALFGSQDIAHAIIDWRDKDDTPQPEGAEDSYYASLATPYHCKNAPFDTVGELLLVKGITKELLEHPLSEDGAKLQDLVTVNTADANTQVDGETLRLNLKTADFDQLKKEFSEILENSEIEAIITYRDGTIVSPELKPGSSPGLTPGTEFQAAGEIIQIPGLSREKVAKIYDHLTVSTEETRAGLININTAPFEVLALVPGLDDGMAKAIIAHREAQGAFTDVGNLLAVDEVTSAAFARAADALTVRSRQFKISSTGRLEQGAVRTVTCLVDAADGKANVTYWRE